MLSPTPALTNPSPAEVERHLGLVKQVVARFLRRLPVNVLRDDLMAAGVYGLVDALRKNGGDHGPTFEAYARIRIRGAIVDELRTQDWLPRRARSGDDVTAVVAMDDLAAAELGAHLLDPNVEDADATIERIEANERIARAVDRLPERERTIVRMHYFHGARFKDIGTQLGVSEPRISQLHSRAVKQLEKLLATSDGRND